MLSLEELKQYHPWLVSVARSGSSVLPWITNPRDTDYIFYVRDNTISSKLIDLYKHKPQDECWLVDTIDRDPVMSNYEYQNHFRVLVYGTWLPDYDVLQELVEYKKTLIRDGLNKEFKPSVKQWYHILTGIYFIQNNSYELTDEQKTNICMCHDRNMSLELYNWIQEQLSQFQRDLELEDQSK